MATFSLLSKRYVRVASASTPALGLLLYSQTIKHRSLVTQAVKTSAAWKLGHLNHVAIAVPDMKQATAFWKDIMQADKVSESVPMPEHGVYTVFVELGNTKIELLHPYGDKSPIAGFLAKNKNGGIHHICLNVADIKSALASLKANGVRALNEEPRIGAHGLPVVFLHPKDCGGVLVELEENK
ncbi:methylmalonyl-CoA epimerase family member-like protein [Coemansia spiralis]|nr:methylmalonyl-CoA epimerase family member-like protein [Coemansia spiralis]